MAVTFAISSDHQCYNIEQITHVHVSSMLTSSSLMAVIGFAISSDIFDAASTNVHYELGTNVHTLFCPFPSLL